MTIKYSTNFVPMPAEAKAKTSLPTSQKLNHETSTDMMCCSGEFNTNVNNNSEENSTFKRLFWGSKMSSDFDLCRANEVASDNSTSSISMSIPSSGSSLGGSISPKDSRKTLKTDKPCLNGAVSAEKGQRRKLLQMISHYEQQNKLLEQELAKEKRRRKEELSCVVKSLLCFEAKLKNDMKNVSKRLVEKDIEICRLFTQNRALRNKLTQLKMSQTTIQPNSENVAAENHSTDEKPAENKDLKQTESIIECYRDGLALDELQCFSCRKKLYDIDFLENGPSIPFGSPTASSKDGSRKHDENCTEQGSSSDETASSSFCGVRRTVRYTSKRTSGTFQDYMQARSMNIDDPALDDNSDGNASTLSRNALQNSQEKLNCKSRGVIKLHPSTNDPANENHSLNSQSILVQMHNNDLPRKEQRKENEDITAPMEEEASGSNRNPLIIQTKSVDFSEASPKQVYETSTDDWYASASDQEEITVSAKTTKSYGQDAVNPVLECVNQILLQQSMEETHPTDGPRSMKKVNHVEPEKTLNSKASSLMHRSNVSLIRQSSISGNGAGQSDSSVNDVPSNARNGTLNRKKVHFSTSNSMVHVPRSHEENHDSLLVSPILSRLQSPTYNQPIYTYDSNTPTSPNIHNGTETLNYESIYSNEYEPIGSENNSSNLYVDMEAANKALTPNESKIFKAPPALPPKPANLLKFKKSLQQLDETPDEHLPQNSATSASNSGTSEPDYCSISEVNVAITSVQIVADVHKAPESVASLENPQSELELDELKLGSSSELDEDLCGASQKTDEIEEIFVDIPKLPNVAAIIAPKEKVPSIEQHRVEQLQTHSSSSNEYMLMSPKLNISGTAPTGYPTLKTSFNITSKQTSAINIANIKASDNNILLKSDKNYNKMFDLGIKSSENSLNDSQMRRKPVPNVLNEINRRSNPISPTSNGKTTGSSTIFNTTNLDVKPNSQTVLKTFEEPLNSLPLQAEFDWYNLDAEYGRTHTNMNIQMKLSEGLNPNIAMLEEISEGHESIVTDADEYNLDEEFSLASEIVDKNQQQFSGQNTEASSGQKKASPTINDPVYFSVMKQETSPVISPHQPNQKVIHNIKNNLANFEKFIEGSGLSTKPLPSKRKIYFAGPFV